MVDKRRVARLVARIRAWTTLAGAPRTTVIRRGGARARSRPGLDRLRAGLRRRGQRFEVDDVFALAAARSPGGEDAIAARERDRSPSLQLRRAQGEPGWSEGRGRARPHQYA